MIVANGAVSSAANSVNNILFLILFFSTWIFSIVLFYLIIVLSIESSEKIRRGYWRVITAFKRRLRLKRLNSFLFKETFFPEDELRKAFSAPKKERWQRLKEFKAKLASQKIGLAMLQLQLQNAIYKNPDISLDELYQIVEIFGSRYGIPERIKQVIQFILGVYARKHFYVKSMLAACGDGKILYEKLFGKIPKGEVKVEERPMGVYFSCRKVIDFAFIHSGAWHQQRDLTEEDVRAVKTTDGCFYSESILMPELNGTIMAGKSFSVSKDLLAHEEQHLINNLIRNLSCRYIYHCLFDRYQRPRQTLEDELVNYRQQAEEYASDEILAYFKDGWSAEAIFKTLSTSPRYNYFNSKRKKLASRFKEWDEFRISALKKDLKRIFVQEYQRKLKSGINAFVLLQKSGYAADEIIAIFVHEPLARWPKVAKRLIAAF